MSDLVHIRLDPKLRKAMQQVVKDQYFASETEFIRDSIRKNLETYERIMKLWALKNSQPRLSKPLKKEPVSDIFRKYGLE